MCAGCQRKTSVTAGTLFEDTRTPLRTWFAAIWFLTSQKNGVSALGLQRVLGFGSYETAWAWLHKLRRAMVRPDRDRLRADVEVDYVGGPEAGAFGRALIDNSIVAIAVERRTASRAGRIRIARVPDLKSSSLHPFVQSVVELGAMVRTDGWVGYRHLDRLGFDHRPLNIAASGRPAQVSMPLVHRVASLLQRWLLGTHHGSVRGNQLDYYLDEFTFRFNRRSARHRGLLFFRLLENAVTTPHTVTDALLGGKPQHHILGSLQ
jgi:transposase-like protein